MSKSDDLKQALAENGDYDTEQAEKLKRKIVGSFDAKMRKLERIFWGYTGLFAWLGVFAATHFFICSNTKALLFYGLLTLFLFELTILIKVWYFVGNSKISVLKAIKQLELRRPAAGDAGVSENDKEPQRPVEGLSRWERKVWLAAIAGGAFLIVFIKGLEVQGVRGDPWDLDVGGSLTSNACVTLDPDGRGTEVTNMSFVNERTMAVRSFGFHAAGGSAFRFADSLGNEMPAEIDVVKGRVRYDVRLPRPIMPGRRFSYVRTHEAPLAATEKDGVWTCATDYSYGYDTNEFSRTVVLPEGAEIIEAKPWPVASFTLNSKPTVRFEGTRGCNEPFKCSVKYRLPKNVF